MLERGIDFEHRLVDLSQKPQRLVDLYERARPGSQGAALVPLLESDGAVVVESVDVARFVDSIPCDGPPLLPRDARAAAVVEAFLAFWPTVEAAYYAVLTAGSQPDADARTALFVDTLRDVDRVLGALDGPYVGGAAAGLAECVAAPWIQRWRVTLPHFRNVDLDADLLVPCGLRRVSAWTGAVAARPAVADTAAPDAEMIAAAERYYVTFVTP